MPPISIDALLRLQMTQAEKDLNNFAKKERDSVEFKVKFNTEDLTKQIQAVVTKGVSDRVYASLSKGGKELGEILDKSFEKLGKTKIRGGGGIIGGLTNIITAPLQGLARGAFEGVGREASRKLGMGLSKGLESQLSSFIGSSEFIGEKLIDKVIPDLSRSVIARLQKTDIGKGLAHLLKDVDLKGAKDDLKKQIGELVGEADLLMEQEFRKASKKKDKSGKLKVARKEVAGQFVEELKQQPKEIVKSRTIDKQITSLEKAITSQQEKVKQIATSTNLSTRDVDTAKNLIKNIKSNQKQLASLKEQRVNLANPASQQKLEKLGVDTRVIQGIAIASDRVKNSAKQVEGNIKNTIVSLKENIERAEKLLDKQLKDKEGFRQIGDKAIAEGNIDIAKKALAKLKQKSQDIAQTQEILSVQRLNLESYEKRLASLPQEIQSEIAKSQADILREQIILIANTQGKQVAEIAEIVSSGQEKQIQNIVKSVKAEGEKKIKNVQQIIEKATGVDRQQVAENRAKFDQSSYGKLLKKQQVLQQKAVELQNKKSQLLQDGASQKELQAIDRQIQVYVNLLTRAGQFVAKATQKRVAEKQSPILNSKLELQTIKSRLEKVQKIEKQLIFERDELGRNIDERILRNIAKSISKLQVKVDIARESVDKAKETAVRTQLDELEEITSQEKIIQNAIAAKNSLPRIKRSLNQLIEVTEQDLEVVTNRLRSVNQDLAETQQEIESQVKKTPKAKKESVTATKKIDREIKKQISRPQEIVNQITQEVAARTGTQLKQIPTIKESFALPSGSEGGYFKDKNEIVVTPGIFQQLGKESKIGDKIVELLVHEIRHAFQSNAENIEQMKKSGKFYLSPNKQEYRAIKDGVKRSVQKGGGSRQNEIDAYTFALRNHQDIAQKINKATSSATPQIPDTSVKPQKALSDAQKAIHQGRQELVNQIAKSVEEISNLSFKQVPRLVETELESASALFDFANNQILLPKNVSGLLDKDKFAQLSEKQQIAITEAIAHELRHGLQYQAEQVMGGFANALNKGFFLTPNSKELTKLSGNIELSVDHFKRQMKEKGQLPTKEMEESIRILEKDAYTFADRYGKQIHQKVFGTSTKSIEVILQQIEKEVNNLKQIDLPATPAISSRAFPVAESPQQLQALLEKEFSASGLSEANKRLGLNSKGNKQELIKSLVASYEQDNLKTLEVLARLGDSAKLKNSKVGVNANFGAIEDEQAVTSALKHNQDVLRKVYQQLDKLDDENKAELAQFINLMAKDNIELIDKVNREYKVSGKTGQSLSGTRSQLAHLHDSTVFIGKGIDKGTQEQLPDAFKNGQELGNKVKAGFDEATGINSPAKEFIRRMKFVAQGIQQGASQQASVAAIAGKELAKNTINAFARTMDAEVGNTTKKTLVNIAKSEKGRDVAKEAVVNTVGLVAGKTATAASGGIPGVGLAAEYTASLVTRKAVTDIESTLDALDRVIRTETVSLDNTFSLFSKVLTEAIAEQKRKTITTRRDLDADTSGFVIGNMAAETASALGSHVPLIGAATAMGTNKVALDLRNKLIKQIVAGIEQGINQETGRIERQGDRLGYYLLKGFKDYLDIRSPSGKFDHEMDNVGDGSVKGGKDQEKKLRKAGERLARNLEDGFDPNLIEKLKKLNKEVNYYRNFDKILAKSKRDVASSSSLTIPQKRVELAALDKDIQYNNQKLAKFQQERDELRTLASLARRTTQSPEGRKRESRLDTSKSAESFAQIENTKNLQGNPPIPRPNPPRDRGNFTGISKAIANINLSVKAINNQVEKAWSNASDTLQFKAVLLSRRISDVGKRILNLKPSANNRYNPSDYSLDEIYQSYADMGLQIDEGLIPTVITKSKKRIEKAAADASKIIQSANTAIQESRAQTLNRDTRPVPGNKKIKTLAQLQEEIDSNQSTILDPTKITAGKLKEKNGLLERIKGKINNADFAIGKMMASSIRGNLKQTNAVLKQIEKQTAADEKEANAVTKRIQQRINQNLRRANSAIKVIDNRVSSQEKGLNTDNESFIAKARSRIFKNQGIGDAPVQSQNNEQQNILKQVRLGLASFQNDLKNMRFDRANKEAQRTNLAAKDLLANLNVTVTVGRDAGTKIKQSQNAIASLLKQQDKLLKDIDKLPAAKRASVAASVDSIQSQIREEQERIASLKQSAAEAKKLIPIYNQLTKLNEQLESAIESGNVGKIKKIQNEINKTFRTLNQPPPTPPKNNLLGQIQTQLEKIGITTQNVVRTLKGIAALAIGSIMVGGFDQVIRDVTDVTIRFEQLETAIKFSAGSAEAGAEKWAFIRSEAKRLKVDIETTARAYKNFAASTNNTALEGQTDRMFSQLLQGTRVLQLSKEEVDGTITAFSQIISKGTVQSEELRGQIGERIPGAFQIAARAMGVTTQELGKMLELGQVASNDFLPKFTAQLEKETRLGLADSLRTTGAAIADVQNEWKLLQVEVGKVLTEGSANTLSMVSELLEGIRGNLDKIIPVLKVAATTVAIALLPTAITLAKFVGKTLIAGLSQGLTLLVGTNTQLLATNAQLTLMATTSPRLAAMIGVFTKIQAALKLAAAAAKAFLIIETITTLIDTFNKTATAGESTRDAIDAIAESYKNLQKDIANRKKDLLPDSESVQKIVAQNKKALMEQKNWFMKFVDGYIDLDRKVGKLTGLGDIGLMKFDEAQVSRINAAGREAIAEAQQVLNEADLTLGFDVSEKSTEDLQSFARAAEDTATSLQVAASQAVDPKIYTELSHEAKEAQKRADLYNAELEKRGDRELTLSKIIRARDEVVKAATKAETKALSEIDAQLLASGDYKKDVELIKLQATKDRLSAELEAEKQAFAKIEELAMAKGGIDPKTGLPKDAQQAKDYEAIETRISELQRQSVENRISITQKEYEVKLDKYDRFLEEVETKRQKAEDKASIAEKERSIELQRLINDGVLTTEKAEELKSEATRDRITQDLAAEKRKLNEISFIIQTDKDLREKQDTAIKESKGKVLDLTLELLEQEQQAEERTIETLSAARDNYYSALEQRLTSLSELRQQYNELDSDRAQSAEKLADLELTTLNRALEIRRQLSKDDLNPTERQDLIRELNSLGIKGKTSELALLQKIEDRERALAKLKLDNLKKQQEQERILLDIENDKLELSTIKAYQEAQKAVNDAEKEVVSTESAIAEADTPEELAKATELNQLAQRSLKLAENQVGTTKQQLDDLDNIIERKKENLKLSQQIAIAEMEAANNTEAYSRRRDRTIARENIENRKNKKTRDHDFLSTEERVDKKVEQAKQDGKEITAEEEEKMRRRFLSQERNRDKEVDSEVPRRRSRGYSISAPPEIVNAINSGKPFVVPSITNKITPSTPLKTQDFPAPQGNLILDQLKKIETKLKTPTVINQENNFTNSYERLDSDRLLRQARSEAYEGVIEAIRLIK